MTREQIDDVAKAARVAAIGQAIQGGNRCVFAIVVCGLDVGAPMAVQSNLAEGKNEDIARILQNGLRALQNSPTGKTGRGGLIVLSALVLWLGAMFMAAAGCGSVTTEADHVETGGDGGGAVAGAGAAGAGAGGNAGSTGVAGGGHTGDLGAAGAAGGAAAGGGAGGGGDVDGGMTGAAGGGGLTGAAGAGDAGKTCAQRVTGAICYQCPAPAATCSVPNRGAWLCCDQAGAPSCDLTWCRQ